MINVKLYTDGSYFKADPYKTYGAMVLLSASEKLIAAQRYVTSRSCFTSGHNVGGELLAATLGIAVAANLVAGASGEGTDVEGVIDVYYDYKGVESFIEGNPPWMAKKESSQLYVTAIRDVKMKYPKLSIKFHKVKAHTGVYWNEIADAIASGSIPMECKDKMLEEVEFK